MYKEGRKIPIELLYAGYDIRKPIGRFPELGFKVKIRADLTEGTHAYIPSIALRVQLCGARDPDGAGISIEGFIGLARLEEPLFTATGLQLDRIEPRDFYVPITGSTIENMLSIRSRSKLVSFRLQVTQNLYFEYKKANEGYSLLKIEDLSACVSDTLSGGGKIEYIVLSTDKFEEMIGKLKHFELLRIEVPVRKMGVPPESHISEALSMLKSAGNKLTGGDYAGALLDTRNAITNHLVKYEEALGRNVIREDIEQEFMEKAPTQAIDTYKEALKQFEHSMTSILSFIHKFVHKDSIKLPPLREDVEFAYFTTVHATKYLSQRIAS